MLTVSAIIRTYNEAEHIGKLLHGLRAQTVNPDELIVVDSGSTDSTVEIAEAAGCQVVRIPKEDFSFGRALNLGCERATSEVLLVVSAHVYPVYDTFVSHMTDAFDLSPVDVVYGRQVGNETTRYSERRILSKWFPEESIWDQGHPFSNNANAAVSRATWAKYRYDENLTGLEDLDFGRRVIQGGGHVAYVAEAPVVHVHEETWSSIRNRYRREAIAYRKIMEGRAMPIREAAALALWNITSDYWHARSERRLTANLLAIPRFRAAQFIGAWEGSRDGNLPKAELHRRFYYPTDRSRSAPLQPPGNEITYS